MCSSDLFPLVVLQRFHQLYRHRRLESKGPGEGFRCGSGQGFLHPARSKTYRANVSLNIDSQYRFSTDVSAEILTSGLLGEQYIGLQQGAEETELKNGDTIEITSSALVLEQLIGKFMTNTVEKNGATQ